MSREVKFRAWDLIEKRFINLLHITFSVDGKYLGCHDIDGNLYGPHQVKLIQYTGLTDKNGVDIYDRDILYPVPWGRIYEQYCLVARKDGCFWAFGMKPFANGLVYQSEDHLSDRDSCQYVIAGNIFENPELNENPIKGKHCKHILMPPIDESGQAWCETCEKMCNIYGNPELTDNV